MILPLLTFPYLYKTLGAENFGIVNMSLSIIGYFNILVSFGFELSATKQIAESKEDLKKVSEIFFAVTTVKLLLLIVTIFIFIFISLSMNIIRENLLIYWVTYGLVLSNVLFPVWFFQGMERMRYITIITLITKVLYTISIFWFVREALDVIMVPIISSISSILNGIIALVIIYIKFNLTWIQPSYESLRKQLALSYLYFVSRVANNGSRYFTTTVIGLNFGNVLVGYYALVEKIFYAVSSLGGILSQVLYPYISRTNNVSVVRKIVYFTSLIMAILTVLLMTYSSQILNYLFQDNNVVLSRMFVVVIFGVTFNVVSSIIGFPALGAMGYEKEANKSLIYASLVSVLYIAFVSIAKLDIIYHSFTVVCYSLVGFLIRLFYVRRHKIFY